MISALLGRSKSNLTEKADSNEDVAPKAAPARVLVTGAGGQTGSIVVRKLLELGVGEGRPFSAVRALVRSQESGERLVKSLGDLKGVEIFLGDVSDTDSLETAFKGVDAVVVCTSAMPRISKLSLAKVITLKLFSFNTYSSGPTFWYEEGQSPMDIDWLGQKAQFDTAEAAGVKHVVLVSSMAGTKPEHFLNTNMQNIVLWKRKAECALVGSGLRYTIIHPGGLLPHVGSSEKAEGKKRELLVAVNDALMDGEKKNAMVPREDLAEVCVRCVMEPEVSAGRSFDLGSRPEGEGEGEGFEGKPGQLKALLETLDGKNCHYTDADEHFCALEPKDGGRGCNCI